MNPETIQKIENSIRTLRQYVEEESYTGYDPYDGLNSVIPFKKMGKWPPILLMQLLKRLPFNIRPLLGIRKGMNPKAIGLFLHAYSLLYAHSKNKTIRSKMDYLFNWLAENYSEGYSGYAWGYNFDWAGQGKMVSAFMPSAVVTGFICRGIYQYYVQTDNQKAKEILLSAAKFVEKDLQHDETDSGLCISYTPLLQDHCFNASLLAAEVLAISSVLKPNATYENKVQRALDFVISYQKPSGVWNYSVDIKSGQERKQIDFHQGYVVESIQRINSLPGSHAGKYKDIISKGIDFYKKEQFFESGRAKWRIPAIWPVEIHNQAQGIITFTLLSHLDNNYLPFALKIAEWTIDNMQDKRGYFYYRKYRSHVNKIPFMRWSQAWMFLSLVSLSESLKSK